MISGVVKAHRVAWMLYRGEIPPGLCVLHRCDVRWCVNPNHLFLGTHQDNMSDMAAKGRSKPHDNNGEANGAAKLSVAKVLEIRARYAAGGVLQIDLATEFGVTDSVISEIITGKAWKSVSAPKAQDVVAAGVLDGLLTKTTTGGV